VGRSDRVVAVVEASEKGRAVGRDHHIGIQVGTADDDIFTLVEEGQRMKSQGASQVESGFGRTRLH